ncbi:MAG: metallophosphoesterase [Planctomycetales bacterium]|nr:metallophosphoesterase [Planctomycetales bacterium]
MEEPKLVPRRNFLRRATWGTMSAAAAAFLYTWRVEPHWVELVERELPVVDLPPELDGKTLVQLSDLHIGRLVDDDYMTRCLESVAAIQPDLVVMTGDWMSCDGAEEVEHVARVLESLQPARLGTFGITGNHDYGRAWANEGVGDQLERRLAELGIRLLRNEAATVEGLNLVGLEDLWSPRFNQPTARRLLAEATGSPSIVLCHNPDACDRPIWGDYQGWILAGHTHGGQCKPPFLPPPLLPVQNRRYTSGEFDVGPGRKLYIHRGVGYLRRVRFNVRPEITAFTLRRATT